MGARQEDALMYAGVGDAGGGTPVAPRRAQAGARLGWPRSGWVPACRWQRGGRGFAGWAGVPRGSGVRAPAAAEGLCRGTGAR